MSRKDCCFILCVLCLVLSYYKIFFIWWAELYKHQFFAMIFWRTDTDDVSTKAFFYHIKQIDSMLWVWTVIDPKWSQNMVGTSGHTQLHFRCKFLFLPHFDIISDLLLLLGQWGIYLLNFLQSVFYCFILLWSITFRFTVSFFLSFLQLTYLYWGPTRGYGYKGYLGEKLTAYRILEEKNKQIMGYSE